MARSMTAPKQTTEADHVAVRPNQREGRVDRLSAATRDEHFDESWSPRIEALVRGEHLSLRIALPGFAAEDVEIEIVDDTLVVQGGRTENHITKVCGFYADESSYLRFSRTIQLPSGTNASEAIATFYGGVLQITMQFSPPTVTWLDDADDAEQAASDDRRLFDGARRAFSGRSYRPLLLNVN